MVASAFAAASDDGQPSAPLQLSDLRHRWLQQCIHYGEEAMVPSTWTVDLFALLAGTAAPLVPAERLRFTTTARDVGDSCLHGGMAFYEAAAAGDRRRLGRVVADAEALRWPIATKHLSSREIVADLTVGRFVYICLVDSVLLRCPCTDGIAAAVVDAASAVASCCVRCHAACGCCCRHSAAGSSDSVDTAAGETSPLPFMGHYIVLCGFDAQTRQILYRNPARKQGGFCVASLPELDRARRRRGTDEDLIRVELGPSAAATSAAAPHP